MEELPRPAAQQSATEQLRAWIDWFGIGRLVGSAVAVIAVAVGGFVLVRTPPPSTEALLPVSTTPPTAPEVAPGPVAAPTTQPAPTVVHVTGAVARPGVYEVPPSARVDDVIAAAGGVTDDADTEALNLAAPVPDGSRLRVPRVGETEPPMVLSTPPVAPSGAAATGPVDVNRADADELDSLPGVGPATASAIVTERERNGPFVTVDDLLRVPGVGPAKLEALRDLVVT